MQHKLACHCKIMKSRLIAGGIALKAMHLQCANTLRPSAHVLPTILADSNTAISQIISLVNTATDHAIACCAIQAAFYVQNKNPNAMGEYQRKLAGVWKRHDAHPLKSILPIMMQAPIFIGFFTSLRALSEAKVQHCFDLKLSSSK